MNEFEEKYLLKKNVIRNQISLIGQFLDEIIKKIDPIARMYETEVNDRLCITH